MRIPSLNSENIKPSSVRPVSFSTFSAFVQYTCKRALKEHFPDIIYQRSQRKMELVIQIQVVHALRIGHRWKICV